MSTRTREPLRLGEEAEAETALPGPAWSSALASACKNRTRRGAARALRLGGRHLTPHGRGCLPHACPGRILGRVYIIYKKTNMSIRRPVSPACNSY